MYCYNVVTAIVKEYAAPIEKKFCEGFCHYPGASRYALIYEDVLDAVKLRRHKTVRRTARCKN